MTSPENLFGEAIHNARQKLDISLREAAAKLGISAAHLSRLETNERGVTPNEDLLHRMSKLFKLELESLRTMAANISKSSLRSLDKMIDSNEAREIKAFYRMAKQHNLTMKEAVRVFSDAVQVKSRSK